MFYIRGGEGVVVIHQKVENHGVHCDPFFLAIFSEILGGLNPLLRNIGAIAPRPCSGALGYNEIWLSMTFVKYIAWSDSEYNIANQVMLVSCK